MDNDLNTVPKDKATVLAKGYRKDGLIVLDCFDKTSGLKFISATFRDSLLSALQGSFISYYENGRMESGGDYNNNELDGVWQFWNRDGNKTDSIIYRNSRKVAFATYIYRGGQPVTYSYTDSLRNTFTERSYAAWPVVKSEVFFTGERGIINRYGGGTVKTDSIFSRKATQPQFKGGDEAWRNFLYKNLNAIVAVDNGAREGGYTVIATFIVNEDGSITDIGLESDPGYGMGKEVIRILRLSPPWIPAVQYGHNVFSVRRQPVSFQIESSVR